MPEKIRNEKRGKKIERMARISSAFKALSNETRLAVFENIRLGRGQAILDKEKRPSVCNVASNFDISLSTISHHIKELRNAGLVRCERRGQTIL
jgi:ArsR family transcriptional regulator